MFGLHWGYIVLILIVILIIFGAGRLPEVGGAIGRGLRGFREANREDPPAPGPVVPEDRPAPPTA